MDDLQAKFIFLMLRPLERCRCEIKATERVHTELNRVTKEIEELRRGKRQLLEKLKVLDDSREGVKSMWKAAEAILRQLPNSLASRRLRPPVEADELRGWEEAVREIVGKIQEHPFDFDYYVEEQDDKPAPLAVVGGIGRGVLGGQVPVGELRETFDNYRAVNQYTQPQRLR